MEGKENNNGYIKHSAKNASSSSHPEDDSPEKQKLMELPAAKSNSTKRKPGGWKVIPFVLGNDAIERLATLGIQANLLMFLLTQFHLEQASAVNFINIWSTVISFGPLIGAYISDAYIGRFWTIGFGSFSILLGMMMLTLIAWIPHLHPPPCTQHEQLLKQCVGATQSQLVFLNLGLGLISIGSGGIRPCSIPFGVDQFDRTTDEGTRGVNSFFNWYYTIYTAVQILVLTVVVYIQDNVSWVLGFGIPTICMVVSIFLFFVGTGLYVYVTPEGSVFSGIAHAIVAAYKKRRLRVPIEDEMANGTIFYDPPMEGTQIRKLPLTNKYRFLNKAAIIMEGEIGPNGSPSNPWRLCKVQTIEEMKCILKVIPVWATGIIYFIAMAQQGLFTISQARKMDRHLGPKFQIPPGSLPTLSLVAVAIWLPFYDRVLVPVLRKRTKIDSGITHLQRIGIGMVPSILSMIVAGLVEKKRRDSAILHGNEDGVAPLSVFWLAPQLCLMGFSEAFSIIGQLEFYNKEFPENMRSLANSLYYLTISGASYLSSVLVTIIHKGTRRDGRPDWLTNNINEGRVDYYYYVIAGMDMLNFVYFLIVSRKYNYKASEAKAHANVERDENNLADQEARLGHYDELTEITEIRS